MTKSELIAALSEIPDDALVYIAPLTDEEALDMLPLATIITDPYQEYGPMAMLIPALPTSLLTPVATAIESPNGHHPAIFYKEKAPH